MGYPIPIRALDDRLAFVGTAGSGKTYNAGTGVELLLSKSARVVIADPLGVWWGLRLKQDGKTASPFNVVVFGGPQGDIAINEHAGALIGETVACMAESCIVDLSQIGTKAGERRFMLAFLTALYRKTTGEPLHLIIDEADMFAPQRLMDKDGDAARLLGMMETIVRRGRVKGFIPWLITQRPAVLSKDVLSQADGMVAFKLTASQDRAAIGAWIEGQADQQQGKAILASLPSMQRGQGIVWVPGRGILETASFPEKDTFDSSRTPKRGETKRTASLKPLDLGALKDRLSTIEAETKANDPKALKAEIATLKRQLALKPLATTIDPKAMESVRLEGYERGLADGVNRGENRAKAALQAAESRIKDALAIVGASIEAMDSPAPSPTRRPQVKAPMQQIIRASSDGNNNAYNPPQRRILDSLAFWRTVGHETPRREQVAAVAGYSPGSGNFNNLLGGLKALGAIDYPVSGSVTLIVEYQTGLDAENARTMLQQILTGPQQKILEALQTLGGHGSREQIAEASGYSAGSGNFNNLLGGLRTLCVVDYPRTGEAEITDWAKEIL